RHAAYMLPAADRHRPKASTMILPCAATAFACGASLQGPESLMAAAAFLRWPVSSASGRFHDEHIAGLQFGAVLRPQHGYAAVGPLHIIQAQGAGLPARQPLRRMDTVIGQDGGRHALQEADLAHPAVAARPAPRPARALADLVGLQADGEAQLQ